MFGQEGWSRNSMLSLAYSHQRAPIYSRFNVPIKPGESLSTAHIPYALRRELGFNPKLTVSRKRNANRIIPSCGYSLAGCSHIVDRYRSLGSFEFWFRNRRLRLCPAILTNFNPRNKLYIFIMSYSCLGLLRVI